MSKLPNHYPANLRELLDKARNEVYQLSTWDMLDSSVAADGPSQKQRIQRITSMLDRVITELNEDDASHVGYVMNLFLSQEESDELTGTTR